MLPFISSAVNSCRTLAFVRLAAEFFEISVPLKLEQIVYVQDDQMVLASCVFENHPTADLAFERPLQTGSARSGTHVMGACCAV